jgi:hypothetical protein
MASINSETLTIVTADCDAVLLRSCDVGARVAGKLFFGEQERLPACCTLGLAASEIEVLRMTEVSFLHCGPIGPGAPEQLCHLRLTEDERPLAPFRSHFRKKLAERRNVGHDPLRLDCSSGGHQAARPRRWSQSPPGFFAGRQPNRKSPDAGAGAEYRCRRSPYGQRGLGLATLRPSPEEHQDGQG